MKKKCIYLFISILIISVFSGFTFASVPDPNSKIEPQASETITFSRQSDMKGKLYISHKVSGIANISATFTLQEASFGSSAWINSNEPVQYANKNESNYLIATKYFNVTNQKQFRVKIVYKDTIDGVTKTSTRYSLSI